MDWQYIWEGLQEGLAQTTLLEAIAAFFGVASVYYSIKKNILVFPTGIISTLIYIYITVMVGLYADMGINFYYTAMSIYGWYVWSKPTPTGEERPVTYLKKSGIFYSLAIFGASYLTLYLVLSNYTDSTVPYWDSFTTSSAFVGMWLMAKKKVENWIAWIITDLVSVPLYWHKDLILTSFQFMVFTVMAILGLIAWMKAAKKPVYA
ncbi:nicotinamide riboside transporter PnuC [Litoribacter ruber]|uniref:Nicotinamide riboside transporter PnuC n=1 Tax=Litoribacter ruber TaxID=702568 RepID=A0AAP2CJH4_9BACT|nr:MULTISPECIES: nicotinamide riboside transporter PnuC [Litoribacter]MBS9524336.1 nicotinamide riboside transporter PnuC [Litoribacter alkaliphilus]MBT0809865.1 nicotinamide riboside transporter PnuC [Litoribacter ruber]